MLLLLGCLSLAKNTCMVLRLLLGELGDSKEEEEEEAAAAAGGADKEVVDVTAAAAAAI